MKNEISNHDDMIDSRDIIERIDELENSFPDICEHCGEGLSCLDDFIEFKFELKCPDCEQPLDFDLDDFDELKALKELAKEGEDYSSDWKYGEGLIRDTYFKNYAMELAEDIGAIDPKANWPTTCIDWDQAARELQMDYTMIDFDGIDYWIRSC